MKRIYLAVSAVLATFALAACGSSGSSGGNGATNSPPGNTGSSSPASSPAASASGALPTAAGSVTMGSAKFPESVILADLWADAMSAKGVKVSKKLNIGERPAYLAALNDGSISAVPEYTGSILYNLAPNATAKTPTAVYQALQSVASGKGYAVASYGPAQDSDTITVTKATASKYHLTSIGDLKSVASKLTLGAPPQFKTRPDGVPALKHVYGVTFGRFATTDAGGTVTVNALKNGSVDAADIFSTDPSIVKNGFVSLKDDKSMFAAQNVVPLFSAKTLTQPMKAAVDAVSAKLTTQALAQLVYKVQVQGADPDATAKAWLQQQGLI
jgi:osmoprotectant transport system substrate-binding protein